MKFLLKILLSLFTISLLAQSTEFSSPSKLPAKTGKFRIIGRNNDGIIVRLYGTEDVINVYDDNLKLVVGKTIEFKNKDGLLQHIMLNKTGAVIFYLSQDRKFSVLQAQPVNAKFMEIGKPLLIDTIYDRKDLVSANLRFKTSFDQSTLLIYYPFFNGTTVESIKLICLDKSFSILYNKTIPVNRKERELGNSKSLVDNEGNSFLLLNPQSEDGKEKYDVFYLSSSGDLSMYSIATQKKLFGDAFFDIDNKNGNLIMTAFYDDQLRGEEDAANGFLYSSFDPANGTVLSQTSTPFSNKFVSELTGRETVTNKSLYTFNIRKSVLRNDGGALIVAESFIKDSREMPAPLGAQPGYNNYRTTDIFQFNDIIAFSFNSKGEMEWSKILRKKQASEDDNGSYSSFLIMNEKEKLRFIFLDDISTSGTLSEYVLKSTGQEEMKALFNQEEKDVMLLPKMGKQISPAEVVIPSYKDGFLSLVKISF